MHAIRLPVRARQGGGRISIVQTLAKARRGRTIALSAIKTEHHNASLTTLISQALHTLLFNRVS
jgi:hypothetical protein